LSSATTLQVALVGDRDERIVAHRAIEAALPLTVAALGAMVASRWLATDAIGDGWPLQAAHAVRCVPGGPYRSIDAASGAAR